MYKIQFNINEEQHNELFNRLTVNSSICVEDDWVTDDVLEVDDENINAVIAVLCELEIKHKIAKIFREYKS